MTLSLVLQHPSMGVYSPPVVSGEVVHEIDRYPRMGLTAEIRPDPNRVPLLQTPYGATAFVMDARGRPVFTGPVITAEVTRPDGQWRIEATDPITYLSQAKFSGLPGQHLPGGPVTVPAWIAAVAAHFGVADRVKVSGAGGTVDPRALDVSGKDGWRAVEDQLIANDLDVWVQPDGTLKVGPTARLGDPVAHLRVGEAGTITRYQVAMRRRINRVVITHRCQKQGEDDKYIDGVWQDNGSWSGVAAVGPAVYTTTVDVGEDWWNNPAAKQGQANANAAAAAQTLRGYAREVDVEAVPDRTIAPGSTITLTFTNRQSDRFLVTGMSLPLQPGPMRLTARNPDPDWSASTYIWKEHRHAGQH